MDNNTRRDRRERRKNNLKPLIEEGLSKVNEDWKKMIKKEEGEMMITRSNLKERNKHVNKDNIVELLENLEKKKNDAVNWIFDENDIDKLPDTIADLGYAIDLLTPHMIKPEITSNIISKYENADRLLMEKKGVWRTKSQEKRDKDKRMNTSLNIYGRGEGGGRKKRRTRRLKKKVKKAKKSKKSKHKKSSVKRMRSKSTRKR